MFSTIDAKMDRSSAFSYICNACGRCCRDKVITLSPYDVIAIARAAGIPTGEAVRRFTIRRGSVLKFFSKGECVALDGVRCGLHRGRPLACRLYPLGMDGAERFAGLEAAPGSKGEYGATGTVGDFLQEQDVAAHLQMNSRYATLLPLFRERIASTADFERIEPREFWRIAIREALAESNYDLNPLIDAIFDAHALECARDSDSRTVDAHIDQLAIKIRRETNPATLAAAAAMFAVSLGYSPREVASAA
jgi:Fe-S-cluster containining protein